MLTQIKLLKINHELSMRNENTEKLNLFMAAPVTMALKKKVEKGCHKCCTQRLRVHKYGPALISSLCLLACIDNITCQAFKVLLKEQLGCSTFFIHLSEQIVQYSSVVFCFRYTDYKLERVQHILLSFVKYTFANLITILP